MGGAKGSSNFNPNGKSDQIVMRSCQPLQVKHHRHIGDSTDVPAGDISVGARGVRYSCGYYKRLVKCFTGVLTGKDLAFEGNLVGTAVTDYGAVYFM